MRGSYIHIPFHNKIRKASNPSPHIVKKVPHIPFTWILPACFANEHSTLHNSHIINQEVKVTPPFLPTKYRKVNQTHGTVVVPLLKPLFRHCTFLNHINGANLISGATSHHVTRLEYVISNDESWTCCLSLAQDSRHKTKAHRLTWSWSEFDCNLKFKLVSQLPHYTNYPLSRAARAQKPVSISSLPLTTSIPKTTGSSIVTRPNQQTFFQTIISATIVSQEKEIPKTVPPVRHDDQWPGKGQRN